jgi:hypothetical protein
MVEPLLEGGSTIMKTQLHKRLSQDFVEEILEAFNSHRISEEKACELLGVKRARLNRLRRRWLECLIGNKAFSLYGRQNSCFHQLPEEEQAWLHQELEYIQREARVFRGRFNFAVLAEEAAKRFGHSFHRATIRSFALRHHYYQGRQEEKRKVFVRFETPGPGFLFQHDCSMHRWIPGVSGYQYLILTKDDYSRLVVAAHLFEKETSYGHLEVVRSAVERYGRPQAYYVDQHKIFRFVEHQGIHVQYRLGPDEVDSQFKRALRMLDIGLIYAALDSPESKGKVERIFDYFQRRVPYLCERYRVISLKEAQKIVDEVCNYYNTERVHLETEEIPQKRWNEAIKAGKGRLRPLAPETNLDLVFSLHYPRTVKKDGTFSFLGNIYKLKHLAGTKVTVALIPKQKILVLKDGQKVADFPI